MNVGSYLSRAARTYPDRLGIVYKDTRLTWAEADARANAFAAGLKRLGLQKGDRVGIVAANSHEYLEVLFGIFKAGMTAIPINSRLSPGEVQYHLSDPRASAVVCSSAYAEMVGSVTGDVPSVKHMIAIGGSQPGMVDYEAVLSESGKVGDETVDVDPEDIAWLFYTSGTTGRPKGVMITHRMIVAASLGCVADVIPFSPEQSIIHSAPLSHGAGFVAIAAATRGAPSIIAEKFDPELLCQMIERERVTAAWLVPTQIKMLVESDAVDKHDMSSLQYVVYGGAPMYLEDLQFAIKKLGKIWVQIFGQGESPMTGTYLRREAHMAEGEGTDEDVHRMQSAGIARTDIEIKLVDDDDNVVADGESGEICLRGPTIMNGYWERPEESAETLKGGWLHTGDVGYMDARGYLYVVDRKKDMIISGGMNIYPREIEEVLLTHPAVHECSVIGIPDPKWGEAVKACVVLRAGMSATEADIIEHCKNNLASFKKPGSVDFIDEIPKSGYGKILKRELRNRYWDATTRKQV